MRAKSLYVIFLLFVCLPLNLRSDNTIVGPDSEIEDDEPILGDIDNNLRVDILDMVQLIYLLNNNITTNEYADVDRDGDIDKDDISALQKIILNFNNAEAKTHTNPSVTALPDSATVKSR